MTIETQTKTGTKVSLKPQANGVKVVVHHPEHGDFFGVARDWDNGVTIRSFVAGASRSVTVEIPESDWDAAVSQIVSRPVVTKQEVAEQEFAMRMENERYGY